MRMCKNYFFLVVSILFCVLSLADSTQFLLNAPKAFFDFVSLASSSGSQNPSPLSRIVDYRRKEAKIAELEKHKENTEQEDLLLERQQEAPTNNQNSKTYKNGGDSNNVIMNEASPSLLQKKINKIVTKLRILAQLKNAFSYTPQQYPATETNFETSTTQSNITITFDDPKVPKTNGGDDKGSINPFNRTSVGADGVTSSNNITHVVESDGETEGTSQEVGKNEVEKLRYNPKKETENIQRIYSSSRRAKLVVASGPEKLDLEPEKPFANRRFDQDPKHAHKKPLQTIQTVLHNKNSTLSSQNGAENVGNNVQPIDQDQPPSRFGSVGVFFAELLATMVGLAYGAVAQLTSSMESSPVSL